jgi:uncharacterized protein
LDFLFLQEIRQGVWISYSSLGLEAYLRSMATAIETLAERARPILRRYGVRRASVFGSYARGQEEPASDLDLLVELPPGSSLLDLVGLEQDLTDELGIQVEATTYGSLHPLMRDRVLADERTIL